jgi:hypothetical protein
VTGRSIDEAAEAGAQPDPIFAAMEWYLASEAKIDALPDDGDERLLQAALAESTRGRRALAETVPTTLAGLAAFARFLEHQSRVVLDGAFFVDDREHLAFYGSLARSLEAIAGLDVAPDAPDDVRRLDSHGTALLS